MESMMAEIMAQTEYVQDRLPIEVYSMHPHPLDSESKGYETPVDEETGLPIPILPTQALSSSGNMFVDFHHNFHPAEVLLSGDDAARALRHSRGQDLPRWLHEHYHNYFAGPRLPASREEMFRTCVLACAGVVPRQAIDFSRQGPLIRQSLNDDDYKRIVQTVRHEGAQRADAGRYYRNRIGIFFANYAIEQSIQEVVSEQVIEQFLMSKDEGERKMLGNLMLREAIQLSVDPVRDIHAGLRKQGLVHRPPAQLSAIVKDFFLPYRRKDYYGALEKKFAASA